MRASRPGPATTEAALAQQLRALLGAAAVIDNADGREEYAHDIAGPAVGRPAFVARPGNIEQLRALVGLAEANGLALLPRGGGFSYTGGYLAPDQDCILVDLRGLDRIERIDAVDGCAVVEAGCTWAKLHEALAEQGLRTPFFGPLSGIAATVGGALSQNAAFFGSAEHGVSGDSVLGLEVMLADGSLLRTGAWAGEHRAPFQRAAGPDLTGLFLGDCGALGIKTRIALKLRPMPRSAFASFAFADAGSMADAQVALAGLRGLAECFGFDPQANENLRRTGFTLREKAEAFRDVAGATGGTRGLLAAVGLGVRRTAFLGEVRYSLHLVADGADDREAEATLARARAIVSEHGGQEIADSIPRATRARPFRQIKALLGPDGELWLPVHGIVPLSQAHAALQAVDAILGQARAEMERHRVTVSTLTTLVGHAFLVEPQFFWPDALSPFHLCNVTPAQREAHASAPPRPQARALAARLRREVAHALDLVGAAHFQIGRYYDFTDQLSPPARQTLAGIKRLLDPRGLMNPGVLGLPREPDPDHPDRRI